MVAVSFSPATSGNFSRSIAVSSNDPDHKTFSIPVGGSGVPLALFADCNPAEGDQKQATAGGVKAGKKLPVQLFVEGAPQIKGFTVQIVFDTTKVKFVPGSFVAGPLVPGLTGLANLQKGYVEVGGAALGGGTGGGDGLLGTVTFEAQPGFDKETTLYIPLVVWNRVSGGKQEIQTNIPVTVTSVGGLTGDFNGDGEVNFDDFFLFASVFGTKKGDPNFDLQFDLDSSGAVDFGDFFIFADAFGKKL